MEATALSVGKSVLDGALSYAKSTFAEEVAIQLGIQQDHAFVSDELEMMRSFLMEAHEERDNNKVIKTWVKQVRDTAYDVEDTLQDFAVRVQRPSWWRFPRKLLERRRVAKKMKERRRVAKKMKELRAKVEDVSQRNVRYRLIKGSGSKADAAEQSDAIAAAMFGVDYASYAAKQDNERADLAQLVSKDGDELKVIAVWGTSGDIGQTTIIREAYENPDIQNKFPCRAWVRVMHPWSSKDFVQSLVNQLHGAQGVEALLEKQKTEQDLAKEFNGYVNDRRLLIVLNDLSTIEEWDQIIKCFQNNKKGSCIIVSTSQVEVASLCAGQQSQASEIKQLSADQTVYAFYIKGSKRVQNLGKLDSSSDEVATTSTNEHTVANREIVDDESMMGPDKKKMVRRSVTRNRTSVDASEESQLIGREKEISDIIKLVSNEDNQQVQVISVWGMGGLGKTTLVHGVYLELSDRFEKCVFVTVRRPFNLAELLRSLVDQLLHKEYFKKEELLKNRVNSKELIVLMGVDKLTEQLKRLLEKKSCLIVLDDLLDISEWDQIKPRLLRWLDRTSRIIVTTRKENIANHCSGEVKNVHNLQILQPGAAFDLFRDKVLGEDKELFTKNPKLVKEAQWILKKCGGLPLAIVVIRSFLANRPKTLEEWRNLNDNISAELEINPELKPIRTVLEKSYDGLSYELKSCFLYLSIFPEDHIISRRRLVHRWTVEGYSTEWHGKHANEIAEEYFTKLQDRSMILPYQQSFHSRKLIDSCNVHDLIHEIAMSKSMEENLVFRLEEGCGSSTHGTFRHLAISSNWKGDKSEFESIVDLSRIRSLTVFGNFRPFYISDKMRLLRVLDFQDIHNLQYHQLDNIWKLIHLKYLSFRGCYGIDLLPDSLGSLRQLQVLDIRGTFVTSLPKTIIKLRKLQYIHAGSKSDRVTQEKNSLTSRCLIGAYMCATCCLPELLDIDGPLHKALTRRDACTYVCCVEFPSLMTDDFYNGGVMVSRGTRKLKDLHTLREVNVGSGNAILHDINMLTGLRKLGVAGINRKNSTAFCQAICSLNRLESLSVRSAGKQGLRGCLDGISSPPENLQSLKLYGNLETLPEWIKELPRLVKLKLVCTMLLEHDAAMEFLGKLPELKILVMSWSSFKGEELDFKSLHAGIAFESLRVLWHADISGIKSVKFEEGTMPKLERLHLQDI